jgi:hypothetical protein
MSAAPVTPVVQIEKVYPDEIGISGVVEILGLSKMRAMALVREGKVPSGQKNSQGFWKFSKAAVEEFAKNRVRHARISDGSKTFKVRLTVEQQGIFAATFPETPLAPAYNYEAQQKSKAKQAAKKAAAALKPTK